MLLIVMSTLEPEGWTISEYKTFKVTNDDDSGTSTDGDSDDEEQIFAKSSIVRRPKYKKLVEKEELLPE
jgi:hypothetical protein|tara:strand:- start:557 stop:763 length:207 start_codon:yes stop_codon:yes gene_type:complete